MNWLQLAKNRVRKILRKRRVCSIKQLESKISEAGPNNMRAEPDFITKATKALLKEGILKSVFEKMKYCEMVFYLSEDYDENSNVDKERFNYIKKLYEKYFEFSHSQKNCGFVLEKIIKKAAIDSDKFTIIGGPGYSTNNLPVNGKKIVGDIDLILLEKKTSKAICVEVKNKREWLYGKSKDIWSGINKAISNELPLVLIARKFPYITRIFFKELGILGFETHNQYFHPKLQEKMSEIKHKDGLGFADIRFSEEPEERHVNFFKNTITTQIISSRKKFFENEEILLKYSEILSQDINTSERESTFYDFLREIGLMKEEEEYPEDYYDMGDYNDY